jgi:hypothetical protein
MGVVRKKEAVMAESNNHSNGAGSHEITDKDTLFMLSGVAFMVFGAGLVLSNPIVRRYLGNVGIGNLAQSALPELDRYLKLRSM